MSTYQKYKPAWLQLLIFGALTIGLSLTLSLIVATIVAKVFGLTLVELASMDLTNPSIFAASKILQAVSTVSLFLVPSLVFAYLSDKQPMKYAGFRQPVPMAFYFVAIILILSCFPMVSWLNEMNQQIHFPKAFESTEKMIREAEAKSNDFLRKFLNMKSPSDLGVMLLILAVLPAISEELFFRGILQRIFIQLTTRPWVGIIITAIIFSALHGQFLGFFPRMVLGMVLGALYWYSGSLYPGIIAHFLNNAIQVVVVYYRPDMLDKEPEFSAALIAGSTILVILITWWIKRISQTSYAEVYDTDDDFHIGPRDQYIA